MLTYHVTQTLYKKMNNPFPILQITLIMRMAHVMMIGLALECTYF